jgi:hypothetical protein
MIVRPLLFACFHKITKLFSKIKMSWPDMADLAGNDRFCPLLSDLERGTTEAGRHGGTQGIWPLRHEDKKENKEVRS